MKQLTAAIVFCCLYTPGAVPAAAQDTVPDPPRGFVVDKAPPPASYTVTCSEGGRRTVTLTFPDRPGLIFKNGTTVIVGRNRAGKPEIVTAGQNAVCVISPAS